MSTEAIIAVRYLKATEDFPLNVALEYLFTLINCRDEKKEDIEWVRLYNDEIEFTKEILKILKT